MPYLPKKRPENRPTEYHDKNNKYQDGKELLNDKKLHIRTKLLFAKLF